jgi:Histidine kinase-, DNA gyrase B-, and HSP90-like ATPase
MRVANLVGLSVVDMGFSLGMNGSFALGILAAWPGQAGRAAPGARRSGGRAGRAVQELRAARAAARRRVGVYTAIVTAVGFAWLVHTLAGGAAGRSPVSLSAFAAAASPSSWSTTCWWRRCWCWPGAPRRSAGSARGWACGPGCRPCCWGWRRWSPWSPRPASAWSRSSSCPPWPSTWPAGGRSGPTTSASSSASPQLDSGAARRAGGVGLGLYIARQLSQAQGGELLVADTTPPGRGARFELRLPLAERSPAGVLAYAASSR